MDRAKKDEKKEPQVATCKYAQLKISNNWCLATRNRQPETSRSVIACAAHSTARRQRAPPLAMVLGWVGLSRSMRMLLGVVLWSVKDWDEVCVGCLDGA